MVEQIFELTMDVAKNVYWWDKLKEDRLPREHLLGGRNQLPDLFLLQNVRQILLIARLCLMDCVACELVVMY